MGEATWAAEPRVRDPARRAFTAGARREAAAEHAADATAYTTVSAAVPGEFLFGDFFLRLLFLPGEVVGG